MEENRGEVVPNSQLESKTLVACTPNQVLSSDKHLMPSPCVSLQKFQQSSPDLNKTVSRSVSLDVPPVPTEVATLGALRGSSCPLMATADICILRATVNKERKVKVTARDDAGKSYPQGTEIAKGSFSFHDSDSVLTEETTTDNGDDRSVNVVSFTPTTTGRHELKDGQQKSGSAVVTPAHQGTPHHPRSPSGFHQSSHSNPASIKVTSHGTLHRAPDATGNESPHTFSTLNVPANGKSRNHCTTDWNTREQPTNFTTSGLPPSPSRLPFSESNGSFHDLLSKPCPCGSTAHQQTNDSECPINTHKQIHQEYHQDTSARYSYAQPTMVSGVKPCRCGSTTHQRTNHSACPLNKRYHSPQSSSGDTSASYSYYAQPIATMLSGVKPCRCGSTTHQRTNHSACPLNKRYQ